MNLPGDFNTDFSVKSFTRMLLNTCLHAALLSVATSFCWSQSRTAIQFSTETQLVEVPVVVYRNGDPVHSLKQSDFVVKSNGKPQQISLFQEVDGELAKSTGLARHVASNRPSLGRTNDTLIVIIDVLNARRMDKLREATETVIRQLIAQNLPGSILVIGANGLVEVHNFQQPRENLQHILDLLEAPQKASDRAIQSIGLEVVTALNRHDRPRHDRQLIGRVNFEATTRDAVAEVVRAFGPIPGRKKLVWIGQRLPRYLAPLQAPGRGEATIDTYSRMFDWNLRHTRPKDNTEVQVSKRYAAELKLWKDLSDRQFRVLAILDEVPDMDEYASIPVLAQVPTVLSTENPCIVENEYQWSLNPAKRSPDICYNDTGGCFKRALAESHYYILAFYLHEKPKPGVYALSVSVHENGAQVAARQGYAVH